MERIVVVGTTGSGKTTIARQISKTLDLPCVELDAIHWLPNWTELPQDEMAARVAEVVKGDRWVIEGGYSFVRDLIWPRADTLIWLDYPFGIVFGRLFRRTVRRSITGETLWPGCRESFGKAFSSDSILLWCIKTHQRNHRKFTELVKRPEYAHLDVLRFRHPREADAFIDGLVKSDVPVR
jgi:adenylate kinase family enzyme